MDLKIGKIDMKMLYFIYKIIHTSGYITGLTLGLHQANERRRYFVTTSLIGWAQI